ncbi:uncharacterized protein LOC117124168 [Anneissia japonica]|uniref:uncharacterized protein LOC117124168 n=1 Tax=Anneissia japonica TaxID=1529436 RepID=UPI001425AEC7|nr:uncharacterized protein LOC117124168 [Anneissia japonica]
MLLFLVGLVIYFRVKKQRQKARMQADRVSRNTAVLEGQYVNVDTSKRSDIIFDPRDSFIDHSNRQQNIRAQTSTLNGSDYSYPYFEEDNTSAHDEYDYACSYTKDFCMKNTTLYSTERQGGGRGVKQLSDCNQFGEKSHYAILD